VFSVASVVKKNTADMVLPASPDPTNPDKEKRGVPDPEPAGHNKASGRYPIPVSPAVQEGADGNSGKKHRPDEGACWRDSSPTVS